MKIKLTICLLLLSYVGISQGMPVYDNTNFLTLGKTLIESGKQTSQLLKTVDFLKQQKERLELVSSVIRQLNIIENISRNREESYSIISSDLRTILESPFIMEKELLEITLYLETGLEQASDDLVFIKKLLSNNMLSMSDAERYDILMDQQLRSREMLSDLKLLVRRYRSVVSFREIADKISNRKQSL